MHTAADVQMISEIHDRMPVIFPEPKINEWIAPDGEPDRVAKTALTDLVVEKV